MPFLIFAVLGFIAFVVMGAVWAVWVALWVVAWIAFALLWLLWPVALVAVIAIAAWRARPRNMKPITATGPRSAGHASGNSAFDAYREETLRRLEEERQKFREFLERLRKSKDKAEFDAFMQGRRQRPA